jgi:NAD(P)-dependent dehydrogenase (short-subunit alcohol dehydrogenase family)
MQSVLIIGASRGLGLEFVRQYRKDSWLTLATCRNSADDALITATGATVIRLDVTDPSSFANLTRALDGRSLDLCVYNAGVTGSRSQQFAAAEKSDFDTVMHTNVLGAMHAATAVSPALARAQGKFVGISSMMGSIGTIKNPSSMLYRASKAALNAVVKCASLEYAAQGVTCFVLHPGWVKTDMGGANADIDPATSITGMRKVIANADATANGKFFNYDGSSIVW